MKGLLHLPELIFSLWKGRCHGLLSDIRRDGYFGGWLEDRLLSLLHPHSVRLLNKLRLQAQSLKTISS